MNEQACVSVGVDKCVGNVLFTLDFLPLDSSTPTTSADVYNINILERF